MPATLEQAITAVRTSYGEDRWLLLDATEQTRAIYREMRRLDLEETMTRRALARAAAGRVEANSTQRNAGEPVVATPPADEPLRCSAFIKTRIGDRCTWQPVVVHEGRPYCGFHNPQRHRATRSSAAPDTAAAAAQPLLAVTGG